MSNKLRIAIVGGGIVGVSTGLALQQVLPSAGAGARQLEIEILSEQWSPNTTGDVSAGLIYPYLAGESTPDWLLERLLCDSIDYFRRLYREDHDTGLAGLALTTVYDLFEENLQTDGIMKLVGNKFPNHHRITQSELSMFPSNYKDGYVTTSFIAEVRKFLPYLMQKFEKQGGRLITTKVSSLGSLLSSYDHVVNCAGIEARLLRDVDDQVEMIPIRGQVIRVRAPWIRHAVMAGNYYILPNNSCVILGGTKQKNDWNLVEDPEDSKKILQNCCQLIPSLAKAEIIETVVGLRPGRKSLRIEIDPKQSKIVHNYGHGGSGVTLAFSSGLMVAELLQSQLRN